MVPDTDIIVQRADPESSTQCNEFIQKKEDSFSYKYLYAFVL